MQNLNLASAKSADLAAFRPSFPKRPRPTWASCIMETSLAPSPMAHVIGFFLLFLTRRTTFSKH